jgi:hypothetical protein
LNANINDAGSSGQVRSNHISLPMRQDTTINSAKARLILGRLPIRSNAPGCSLQTPMQARVATRHAIHLRPDEKYQVNIRFRHKLRAQHAIFLIANQF